jgi:hypothetical protein
MNIFRKLFGSKRRERKNKPVPVVPHKAPIRQEPEPAEPKIKAVTYNRVDGQVSGGLLQAGPVRMVEARPPLQQTPKRAEWDEDNYIYKGKARNRYAGDDGFIFYANSTDFDDAFFYQSEETPPERGYTAPESASGYDYTPQPISEPYVAPSPSYEAPTYTAPEPSYSAPSYSSPSYDSGSGSSYSGYSGSSSSYSDSGSSSSYSDSGSSGGGYSSD